MYIQMKYLKKLKSGIFEFRRRVPGDVQGVIGKREFKTSLSTRDQAEAIRQVHKLTSESDLEIKRARERIETGNRTNLTLHQAQVMAHKWLQAEQTGIDANGQKEDYQSWLARTPEGWVTLHDIGVLHEDDIDEHAMRYLSPAIEQELAKYKLSYGPDSAEFKILAVPFNLAAIQLSRYCLARLEHRTTTIDTSLANSELNLHGSKYLISEVFDRYQKDKLAAQVVTEETLKETYSQLEDFIAEFGDLDIRDVTRELVADYRSLLLSQPKGKSKNLRTLTLTERKSLADQENLDRLSPNTVKNKVKKLSPVFTYALDLGIISANPFDRQTKLLGKTKSRIRDIEYSEQDIQKIFSQPLFTEGPSTDLFNKFGMAAYWFPILSYYTGARREEICQLRKSDFDFDPVNPFIMISDEHDEQSVKTVSSVRRVPIHPHILELGLKEYVEPYSEFVFPKLSTNAKKKGNNIGKWWGKYVRSIGIKIEQPSHGFRHTFIGRCRDFGIVEADQEWITGHNKQKVSRNYGSESIRRLNSEILKIPQLEIQAIHYTLK